MYNAPYNEIDYTAECVVVIRKNVSFSAQPGLGYEEKEQYAREELENEFGNTLEAIESVEAYPSRYENINRRLRIAQ